MSDLQKRLLIKAGAMEMGECIAWGSDIALMREAADRIAELTVLFRKVLDEYYDVDLAEAEPASLTAAILEARKALEKKP